MIKIEFVAKVFEEEAVWVIGIEEGQNHADMPLVVLDALKKKPFESVIEVFVPNGKELRRYIVSKLENSVESPRKQYEDVGSALFKKVLEGSERVLVVDIRHLEIKGLDLVTSIVLSSWRFDKYRTVFQAKDKAGIDRLVVLCQNPEFEKHRFKRHKAIAEGVFLARSLTFEPSNVLYPRAYAERLNELEAYGIKVEILDENALKAIGMNALLAVGKGSIHSPTVAILTWNGTQINSQPIVVVGKGVCFDSGGLCLKPPKSQPVMKCDKAGASAVAGWMKALALQGAPIHAVGIIGLVENMPDGNAAKPGDVVHTMSGQTIEIVDTDAEGRLVLADCLWYAQERFHPKAIVDLGTLTIETIASLGNAYAGLYTNFPSLAKELKDAGKRSGDQLWELPMGDFFAKQIESSIADMKNIGIELCGENGAAAEFLKRFVKDTPWAHIDIAGVSWTKDQEIATGFGVRLLEEWSVSCFVRMY